MFSHTEHKFLHMKNVMHYAYNFIFAIPFKMYVVYVHMLYLYMFIVYIYICAINYNRNLYE